ncbi:MAG TPA: Phenylacetic acid catabolic protein [Jiangellaceae bacterium]|nr:Phenylacetic acid catabolic protein [Jiangellaceae bacterium]
MLTEEEVLERIASGRLIEGPEHASEGYLKALKQTLVVSGDTEMISAPAYMRATQDAPNLGAYMTETGAIQDELGHAHIAYRMLADLGEDMDQLVYERPAKKWKYPYAFDVPLDSWVELVVANGLYDRAGYVLLGDIHKNSSFGPWKRALLKVEKEEAFHLRHGERWMKIFAEDPERRDDLQRALDWMFVLTLEWFGLPDHLKRHEDQIKYQIKARTNDELRQQWMSSAVPLCEKLGMSVPAHYDEAKEEYVIDCPFPMAFDPYAKEWDYDGGQVTWDDVMERWRGRGPANEEFVGKIQRGYQQLQEAA